MNKDKATGLLGTIIEKTPLITCIELLNYGNRVLVADDQGRIFDI